MLLHELFGAIILIRGTYGLQEKLLLLTLWFLGSEGRFSARHKICMCYRDIKKVVESENTKNLTPIFANITELHHKITKIVLLDSPEFAHSRGI